MLEFLLAAEDEWINHPNAGLDRVFYIEKDEGILTRRWTYGEFYDQDGEGWWTWDIFFL